jgi:hypothetical protein
LLGAQTGFTAVGGFLVGRFHGFRSYAAKGFGSHIDLTKSHFASNVPVEPPGAVAAERGRQLRLGHTALGTFSALAACIYPALGLSNAVGGDPMGCFPVGYLN